MTIGGVAHIGASWLLSLLASANEKLSDREIAFRCTAVLSDRWGGDMWTIAFVGFIGLGVRLARGDWRYIFVGAPLLLLMLPYVLAQPILRDRYPVGGLLVFLAADLALRMTRSVLKRLAWPPPLGDLPAQTPQQLPSH